MTPRKMSLIALGVFAVTALGIGLLRAPQRDPPEEADPVSTPSPARQHPEPEELRVRAGETVQLAPSVSTAPVPDAPLTEEAAPLLPKTTPGRPATNEERWSGVDDEERDREPGRTASVAGGTAPPVDSPEPSSQTHDELPHSRDALDEPGEPAEPHLVTDIAGLQDVSAALLTHDHWMPDVPAMARAADGVREARANLSPNDPAPGLALLEAVDHLLDVAASGLDPGGARLARELWWQIESGDLRAARETSIELAQRY